MHYLPPRKSLLDRAGSLVHTTFSLPMACVRLAARGRKRPDCVFEWSDVDLAVRGAVREFVDKEIRPHVDALESGDMEPYPIIRKLFATFGIADMARDSLHKRLAHEQIAGLNEDKSEVYQEAKSFGLDVKALKALVAKRRKVSKDPAAFTELEAVVELYEMALKADPHAHARERRPTRRRTTRDWRGAGRCPAPAERGAVATVRIGDGPEISLEDSQGRRPVDRHSRGPGRRRRRPRSGDRHRVAHRGAGRDHQGAAS